MEEHILIPNYLGQEISNDAIGNRTIKVFCKGTGSVSDGYHSFDELYEHRCLLYLAFLKAQVEAGVHDAWRSKAHHDGTTWDGWFIVGTEVQGQQITYHLPMTMWRLCDWLSTWTYDRAPVEWDGHSSQDVCDRLKGYLSLAID